MTCACCSAAIGAGATRVGYLRLVEGVVVGFADYAVCVSCLERAERAPDQMRQKLCQRWEAEHVS